MRGGHCLEVWTKKQQGVSLSTAESELYAAVKTASEGLGIQSVAKDLGDSMGAESALVQGETRERATRYKRRSSLRSSSPKEKSVRM